MIESQAASNPVSVVDPNSYQQKGNIIGMVTTMMCVQELLNGH